MTASKVLAKALTDIGPKPGEDARASDKKRYSERMSAAVAQVVSGALLERGLTGARPSLPGESGISGAERRMAGGIGNKKVDVTWATEESGLMLAFSIKCITSRDAVTKNYQRNFTNRRGDMLFEAVTLHRRFPYATLVGLFIFDEGAASDATDRRASTFDNAHRGLSLFSGRVDPSGREEQYEKLYVGLASASASTPTVTFSEAGAPEQRLDLDQLIQASLEIVVARNSDSYRYHDGKLRPVKPRS